MVVKMSSSALTIAGAEVTGDPGVIERVMNSKLDQRTFNWMVRAA